MRLLTRSCLDWKKYCQYSMLTFWPAVAGAVWAVASLAGLAVEPAAQAESSPAAAAPAVNCNRWRRLNWFISLVYLPGGTNGPRYPQRSGAELHRADS